MFSQRANQSANRRAFRPTLDTQPLEERVVLNGAGAQQLQASVQSGMGAAQVRQAYRAQLRTIANDLRTAVNARINALYAGGQQPTAGQFGEFREELDGIINANVIRLSASASLLPNAGNRLVPNIQRAFLKDTNGGILRRLTGIIDSAGKTRNAQAFGRAVNNQLNRALIQTNSSYNTYFSNAGLNRNSVDADGNRVGLQQYLGDRIITQYGNALGSVAAAFPTVGNAGLFPNGLTNSTPEARTAFTSQYNNALNTVAYQLGSNLSLFPGMNNVNSGLQSSLFGSDPTANSLSTSLNSLIDTGTNTDFSNLSNTAFNTAFSTTSSSLANAFQLPRDRTYNLPNTDLTTLINQPYLNFGNGFNTGFGSGSTGFGSPTGANYNPAFGTGFNNFVTSTNPSFGFTGFSTGSGTVVGGGSIDGGGVIGGF